MKPYFIKLKALANKEWWALYLNIDLTLSINHICDRTNLDSTEYSMVLDPDNNTNIQCVKCHKRFNTPVSKNGGRIFDYFKYNINHSELYNHLNKKFSKDGKMVTRINDPLILEKSKVEIENIVYMYTKFLAGFSIISHFTTKGVSHISAIFINENESNLLEVSESKPCSSCKKYTAGASLKGFLMLSAKLKPNEQINA